MDNKYPAGGAISLLKRPPAPLRDAQRAKRVQACRLSVHSPDTRPAALKIQMTQGPLASLWSGPAAAVLAPLSQWPLPGRRRGSSLLSCVAIDRRRETSGSISGSDLLAVQIGNSTPSIRGAAACETRTPRISCRSEEQRQTSVSTSAAQSEVEGKGDLVHWKPRTQIALLPFN